jgi:hypothetical protein
MAVTSTVIKSRELKVFFNMKNYFMESEIIILIYFLYLYKITFYFNLNEFVLFFLGGWVTSKVLNK